MSDARKALELAEAAISRLESGTSGAVQAEVGRIGAMLRTALHGIMSRDEHSEAISRITSKALQFKAERDAAQARAERAEAEVKRLRAALERIADTESPALEWPRRHAKAALAAQVSR